MIPNIIPEIISFDYEEFDEKEGLVNKTIKAKVICISEKLVPTPNGSGEDFIVICFDESGKTYERFLNEVKILKYRNYDQVGATFNSYKKKAARRTETAKRNNNSDDKKRVENKGSSDSGGNRNKNKTDGGKEG